MVFVAPTLSTLSARIATLAESQATIEDSSGKHAVGSVVRSAVALAKSLSESGVAAGGRVLLDGPASAAWARAFFALSALGAIAVPVARVSTRAELEYLARDSGATRALVTHEGETAFPPSVETIRAPWAEPPPGLDVALREAKPGDVALVLYTSGTTGAPKGALITQKNLATQTAILEEAWGLVPSDVLLHALPMHHLHGIVVAFLSSLFAGASVIALPKFDAEAMLDGAKRATVMMAVPTMYTRMLEAFDRAPEEKQKEWSTSLRGLRLLTSGSAALPVSLAERLRSIAGVLPLERYGMTEIGMALSNPLDPGGRREGRVGAPLPSVEVRIVDDTGKGCDGPGELWVRGPSVFAGYHGRDEATRDSFRDGWFLTGDVAERNASGSIRLLGRSSVDILKSGGEKVSAIEVEEVVREHPSVADAAVVGVPDETWGDRVVAFVIVKPGVATDDASLRAFAKERLAPYKVPKEFRFVEAFPRNAMGKVQKRLLV